MSSITTVKCSWQELLNEFKVGLENAITELNTHNIETIHGALPLLLNRLNIMRNNFPTNNGQIFEQTIDKIIQNAFFPKKLPFAESFEKILDSRTHEQDFIINELINGFIASKTKVIASYSQGRIIDRMVEAFSKRNDFHIVDYQFYAMFGDPNKPRAYVMKNLQTLIDLFGLVSKQLVVDKDIKKSEEKVYTFYTFPDDILIVLKKKYLVTNPITGNLSVSEAFDRNVFICLFLANTAVNRNDLESIGGKYTVNGISAIFALILVLSFMPMVTAPPQILNDPSFSNPSIQISVIPKSWMMKKVLESIFEPLIKIVAFRLGGMQWCEAIIYTEINKKIHNQIRFLLKDVNKWILGELCRVEIPIFIRILNTIQVTLRARGSGGTPPPTPPTP